MAKEFHRKHEGTENKFDKAMTSTHHHIIQISHVTQVDYMIPEPLYIPEPLATPEPLDIGSTDPSLCCLVDLCRRIGFQNCLSQCSFF
jgi:hypothetical protein